jgi:hypothetical protein
MHVRKAMMIKGMFNGSTMLPKGNFSTVDAADTRKAIDRREGFLKVQKQKRVNR